MDCSPGSAAGRPACLETLCLTAATTRVPVSACIMWYHSIITDSNNHILRYNMVYRF